MIPLSVFIEVCLYPLNRMNLGFLKKLIPKTEHGFYISLYTISTVLIVILYGSAYLGISRLHGNKYLPLVITSRNILLSLFLIYFYNPFRSTYNYGRALPIFATAAGISLLLTINKFDILNLVHFILYGTILEKPIKPECKLENEQEDIKKIIQISKKI
jgi:hypothetical protein